MVKCTDGRPLAVVGILSHALRKSSLVTAELDMTRGSWVKEGQIVTIGYRLSISLSIGVHYEHLSPAFKPEVVCIETALNIRCAWTWQLSPPSLIH